MYTPQFFDDLAKFMLKIVNIIKLVNQVILYCSDIMPNMQSTALLGKEVKVKGENAPPRRRFPPT